MRINVITKGMGCEHCIKRVTAAMESIDAKIESMQLNNFTVETSSDKSVIKDAIEDIGFDVVSISEV